MASLLPIMSCYEGFIAFMEDYKIVRKILDWLGIFEFKRYRPPPKRLAVTDLFDDYAQDDYINCDYLDF